MSSTAAAFPRSSGVWNDDYARTTALPAREKLTELGPIGATSIRQHQLVSVGSSTLAPVNVEAQLAFETIFRTARESDFEDGMHNEFSRELIALTKHYGEQSRGILSKLLDDQRVSRDVLAEAMRWLGQMDDPSSREMRLWLLERGLTASSAAVRDGATVGLAALGDPRASRYLAGAMNLERYPELRKDMQQVLEYLTRQL
jgi:hypothetical protein